MVRKMDAIYLDNFRGFKDAVIPLEKVNFLVGENSTGKTSFLNIVNAVNDSNFLWFQMTLEIPGMDFISFDDMVSVESENKTDFTIGYVTNYSDAKSEPGNVHHYVIVTYKSKSGKPYPSRVTYSEGNSAIVTKIYSKKIGYLHIASEKKVGYLESFKRGIDHHHVANRGFSYLGDSKDDVRPNPYNMPFYLIKDYIRKRIKKSEKIDSSLYRIITYHKENLVWLAPIRGKPERIYDYIKPSFSPEGTHTPHVLNDVLNKGGKYGKEFQQALYDFGRQSGLFKEVISKRFGESEAVPFEINIVLSKKPLKITNVGYGVAQILPVIVESFIREKNSSFCIQQPEVHLHPKAQSALGNFFFALAKTQNKKFLIETHSDYLIDRYRISTSKSKKKVKSQALFFERVNGQNHVHSIKVNGDGSYSSEQPESFRSFFFKEQLDLLNI